MLLSIVLYRNLNQVEKKLKIFCNVMRSYDQSHDGSNLIKTIYIIENFLLIICHLTYLNFLA